MGSNVTAAWKAHKRGAFFANPCFTQIHPTCIPVSGDHQVKINFDVRVIKKRWKNLGSRRKQEDAKAIRARKD